MTNMLPQIRRCRHAATAMLPTAALLALACLVAGCASISGGTPEQREQTAAAEQTYDKCLRRYVPNVDDGTSDPKDLGEVLATYCEPEFNAYSALTGAHSSLNQRMATDIVKTWRQR